MTAASRAPLDGITVLGLEQAIAAPLCTRHLADLGARVINANRVRHRAELDELLGGWCAGLGLAEIQRRADDAGIGNARLNGVSDLAGHPQLASRERWVRADSPVGPLPVLLPPALALGWSAVPGRVPALGADTEAIRSEVAGHVADH